MTALKCPNCTVFLEKIEEDNTVFYSCPKCPYSQLGTRKKKQPDPLPETSKQPDPTPDPVNNPTHDPVNNPSHYTQGGIECIDGIQAALTPEEFRGFLKGNTIKYLWRMNHKNSPSEDASKAQWYLERLIKELKK